MNIQTNYDYIPNLKYPYLISVKDHLLDLRSLECTITIPVKNYSVEQIIEVVCQNVECVDMIFYSITLEKLVFYSSVPMDHIERNIDILLEKDSENKRDRYKVEAEKFVEKMEALCEPKNHIPSQEFSLKHFLDMIIEKYQKEMDYIHELEKKWKHIMAENHIFKDKDSRYGNVDGIYFDYFGRPSESIKKTKKSNTAECCRLSGD